MKAIRSPEYLIAIGLSHSGKNIGSVFENRALRRMFGPQRDDLTGGWRKLLKEEQL
jgi:hypothetical protein